MVTIRNYRRSAFVVSVVGAVGVVLGVTAAPAWADNSIEITGVGPANVGADYSCEASAGVVGIKVMVGDPQAESPSATGTEAGVICDGSPQSAVVIVAGVDGSPEPIRRGQTVQVRMALVDATDTVISGTAKVVSLG
ncbi:hypothetical protein ACWIGW_24910 [Nocardia brasiliensis]